MSGTSVLDQNIPQPSLPLFDTDTGVMHPIWYRFFLSLFSRTGGSIGILGIPGGVNGNVQYNNKGAFGGLTNIQLTALIQPFTAVANGDVPASGGGTVNFLRADATFHAPPAAGPAGGDLSGTYPNPTVAQVNAVAYPAAPTKNTIPVVTGANVVTYETAPVAAGGTGLTNGTSGGVLGFTAAGTITSSAALTQHALVVGGGAGATPTVVASLGTATTVLHGNAAGDPTFAAVSLTADVTGTLPVGNGGTGATAATGTGNAVLATNPTLAGVTVNGDGLFHLTGQTSDAGAATATMTNAPTAGNPTFWLRASINGTSVAIPAWVA